MATAAQVQVRCSGHIHSISRRPNGRLVFANHGSELWIEDDLRRLADMEPACRCAQVLRAVRTRQYYKCPRPLWSNLQARLAYYPAKHPPLRERATLMVRDRALEALEACDYKRSGEHIDYVLITPGAPTILGTGSKAWSGNDKWSRNNSAITVEVPHRWIKVYRQGLATVTDKGRLLFVLEILDSEPSLTRQKPGQVQALVAKQGRGFTINAKFALINTETATLVRWLKG